jgi:hypothetical protein
VIDPPPQGQIAEDRGLLMEYHKCGAGHSIGRPLSRSREVVDCGLR